MGSHLGFLIGLNHPINRIHPGEEQRHCRQELLLQQGDFFFPIGVIDPGPGDQQPPGGVGGEDERHGPVAGLHQGHRILGAIPQNMRSHNDLTPCGAATGRLQDCPASQGASPPADAR
ncbi:hypothetical protein KBY80_12475 [Synechococcus sp. JJ3a-Johnson]|uniref:hypothetical protein n=1 Tax=Synechococcus sp. JJ3a-Johnson TaxID=2823738 RepID=UPI0020CF12C3|nr:hypothetical protein [Synechococcus sp. JJ3a-Johnson]MCP9832187.1 hypothetical protein [Synechococcus sp. JJ3a-Johnson]